MRHPIRSAVVAGASALLLVTGAGTASAQGSLQFALPFPLDIPGLASLISGTGAPGTQAVQTAQVQHEPLIAVPEEVARKAFEGRIVAGINEARTAVGAERLVTDPILAATARVRAEQLAAGDPITGDLTVPEGDETLNRTVLDLPPEATPQNVLTAMVTDTGMRERMLNGDFDHVGVGTAAGQDGLLHVVLDFERG
ncbi:CAP domain-containing protein [Rhodococcus sp. IEGM 1408]|uniref:CAP domain-containing protein n=1 Tax=Rhodococcus sp. IEGM 1408 TaxID=3082220 RepID=UPI002955B907|nr:CAP domain-containing protein [Rhodococcus sp. IEGM 1408]MDV8002205.1 CAP domain-containing protein [Rhodococcus sp. IEGM 1408]